MLQNALLDVRWSDSIFKKPKTNVFILYLLTYIAYYYQIFITITELMYLCLNKLASRLWKKNCPIFLNTIYKPGGKSGSFFHSFIAVLLCGNATNFLIHSLTILTMKTRLTQKSLQLPF